MHLTAIVASVVLGLGCKGEPVDPAATLREIGIIVYFTDTARIKVPSTAAVNEPFRPDRRRVRLYLLVIPLGILHP
jgi:hypothetical protein